MLVNRLNYMLVVSLSGNPIFYWAQCENDNEMLK